MWVSLLYVKFYFLIAEGDGAKITKFGNFGVVSPHFESHDGDILRECADVGLSATPNCVKIAEGDSSLKDCMACWYCLRGDAY